MHEQDLNGLLVRSARCDGINAAVFKPERLSNVRHRTYLTYRLNAVRDTFVAERTPGRKWLTVVAQHVGLSHAKCAVPTAGICPEWLRRVEGPRTLPAWVRSPANELSRFRP